MVKRSLSRAELLSKLEEQEDRFFEDFAKEYLNYLGNSRPGKKQIKEMQSILSHTWMRKKIMVSGRLTAQEAKCLLLASQGKNTKEIASFFNRSIRRIEAYRNSIFKKLASKNIGEAVVKGIRYGEIAYFI